MWATPSSTTVSEPASTATHSREPGACAGNEPISTPGGTVVRMNSNSTPGRFGDRIRRSQPAASTIAVWASRRSTTTRAGSSSPISRDTVVPSAVASRASTSTVGIFAPRSMSEIMLRLTPDAVARPSRLSPRPERTARSRAPSAAPKSTRTTIADTDPLSKTWQASAP